MPQRYLRSFCIIVILLLLLILAIEQRKKWELRVITKGFKIKLIGNDKLRLGPKEKLTPALINKAKKHKAALIKTIQLQPPEELCYPCGDCNCRTCHPPATKQLIKYAINKELKVLNKALD